MFTLKRLWVLLITLSMIACNATQQVNWVEQIEKSDRKSSIKGMLNELQTFREHLGYLQDTKTDPSFNQIDILLNLDRSPISKTEEDHSATIFAPLEEARTIQLNQEEAYIDIKKLNKKAPKPMSLLEARKNTIKKYREQGPMLLPFLQKKLKHKYQVYADSLIQIYYKGEPCRHLEIVDGLSSIGNYVRDTDPKNFKKNPLYESISKLFIHALTNDIQQPPRAALISANTLGRWAAGEHIKTYIKLIKNDQLDITDLPKAKVHFDLRNAMIKLLNQFAEPKHKELLLEILNKDPVYQPISYTKLAATKLGDMKANEAIDRLIECLWLDDARGRNATAACRLALNKLDPTKVAQAALKTFKRQNAKVEERATRLNYAHTGLVEAKSAEIIGDVVGKDAMNYLITSLEHEDQNPASFAADATLATFFVKGQVQKTISIAKTLAILGESDGSKPLVNILKDDKKLFEYKLAASQQLAYLGSNAPIKDLTKIYGKKLEQFDIGNRDLKVQYSKTITRLMSAKNSSFKKFRKSIDKDIEEASKWVKQTQDQIKQAQDQEKKLGESADKNKTDIKAIRAKGIKLPKLPKKEKVKKGDMKDEEYKKKREEVAKAHQEALKKYQEGLSEDQKKLQTLETTLEKNQKAKKKVQNLIFEVERGLKIYETWDKGFKEVKQQLGLVANCKNSASCWGEKLNGGHPIEVRTQAIYVLARKSMNSKTTVQALIKRLKVEEEASIRDVILFALTRHAPKDKESQSKIQAARDHYEAKRKSGSADKTLKNTVYSLDLLLAYLSH